MAVNPAEDIVGVWLQDNQGYFIRQNVNVPKPERKSNGKSIHGGKGKEIDILGTNNKGENIWVEITVSPNPYLAKRDERIGKTLGLIQNKFCKEKEDEVSRIFKNKKFDKLFVYSHRIFRGEQEKEFLEKVKKMMPDIEVKNFEDIFNETIEYLNHYSVDPTRIYLYYVKFFLQKKNVKKIT